MSLTLYQVKDILKADIITGDTMLDKTVKAACGADLMSDVLTFVDEKTMLLTGLNNPHVIRTAEMLDVGAIVFVRGKKPGQDIIDMAVERSIVLFTTTLTLYEACGELYKAGLPGKSGQA
ncbi:MAG TPA: DRTGG domain-containing protein [Bacillota bacterium]|nr:DRTGG domain-containing protein [Bacillota bacterium]